jgi:hypothetical protein
MHGGVSHTHTHTHMYTVCSAVVSRSMLIHHCWRGITSMCSTTHGCTLYTHNIIIHTQSWLLVEENNTILYYTFSGKILQNRNPLPLKQITQYKHTRSYVTLYTKYICDYDIHSHSNTHTHTHTYVRTLSAPYHPFNYQWPGLAVGKGEKQIGNHWWWYLITTNPCLYIIYPQLQLYSYRGFHDLVVFINCFRSIPIRCALLRIHEPKRLWNCQEICWGMIRGNHSLL